MQKSGVRSRFSETNGCRLEMRDVAPRNNWELSRTFWAARSSIPARGTSATFPKGPFARRQKAARQVAYFVVLGLPHERKWPHRS